MIKQVGSPAGEDGNHHRLVLSPPPPPPPPPRFPSRVRRISGAPASHESVTNREIAKFWRRKQVEEEDHLLAAIKAAARIKARNFTEDDYKQFVESLKRSESHNEEKRTDAGFHIKEGYRCDEVHVGIKNWWTKSKYAYLNQPAMESQMDNPKRRNTTYTPNWDCFSSYNYKPAPLYPTSVGVF